MDNFNLRQFLSENKLTQNSRIISEQEADRYTVIELATTRTSDVEDALSTAKDKVVHAHSPESALMHYLTEVNEMSPEDAEDFLKHEIPDRDQHGDVYIFEGWDEKYFVKKGIHDLREFKPEIYNSFGERYDASADDDDDYNLEEEDTKEQDYSVFKSSTSRMGDPFEVLQDGSIEIVKADSAENAILQYFERYEHASESEAREEVDNMEKVDHGDAVEYASDDPFYIIKPGIHRRVWNFKKYVEDMF